MLEDAINPERLRRVLVTKLARHSDVLLATPVFSVLKARVPEAEIDALVYTDTAPLLVHHPALHYVHTIARNIAHGCAARLQAEWKLLHTLHARRYDLLLHLTDDARGAWLARLTGTRYAVAAQREAASRIYRSSFTHHYALPRGTRRHAVELNLDALRRIGLYPDTEEEKKLVLAPGAQAQAAIAAKLAAHGIARKRYVHLHPGSRHAYRCWPAEKTTALVDALHAQGATVVLSAGPEDAERTLLAAILARVERAPTHFSGELSLLELAALTAEARLFVGVNSAPLHIAAALGTPVVALFGPTSEIERGPWMVPHRIVASTQHPCRPCGNEGCGGGQMSECLTTLPVVYALAAIEALLEETQHAYALLGAEEEDAFPERMRADDGESAGEQPA